MSHEIRTPMNGVIGMTDLLLDTDLSAQQREYVELAKQSAEFLLSLINDILDFSKVEAGKLDLELVDFDPRGMLADTIKTLTPRAGQKGLQLECQVEREVPEVLVGDPSRLRQVIVNLIGNAIKFTDAGKVSVHVGLDSRGAGDAVVLRFAVRDSGIGIPKDKQQSIFEAFEQADGSTTRKFGGTGLGLAISANLVQLMGGRIWVDSDPGKGSTFFFLARFAVSQAAPQRSAKTRPDPLAAAALGASPGLNVLLAEDNLINQKVACGMLKADGHRVTVAGNGGEALTAAEREAFDVVLMDIQMPDMDGFEATAQLRERERTSGGRVPIIAMTAHAMKGYRERCLEAGMDGYLAKPVRREELRALLAEIAAARTARAASSSSPASTAAAVLSTTVPATAATAAAAPAGKPAAPSTGSAGVVDWSVAQASVRGDEALLQEIVAIFLDECPAMLDTVHAALAAGDAERLRIGAHTLKGAVVHFGASAAVAVAAEIEAAARQSDLAAAAGKCQALASELNRLTPLLADYLQSARNSQVPLYAVSPGR